MKTVGGVGGSGVTVMTLSMVRQMPREGLEHRHAHGDAHFDLLLDNAPSMIGDGRGDLDTAVHRPGVHDQGIGLSLCQLFVIEPEEMEVLAARGHIRTLHALAL